jgi:hypothetical protein
MPRRGQGIAYWTVRLVLLHVIYVLRQVGLFLVGAFGWAVT